MNLPILPRTKKRRRVSDEIYAKYFSLYLKLGVLAGLVLIILII